MQVPWQLRWQEITGASARLGKGFRKAPFLGASPASSSGAALPGIPPAVLLSETAAKKQKPAWINGPERSASETPNKE